MYIYPDNLRAKATLWLWELRDVVVIGAGLLLSVLALVKLGWLPPFAATASFAFLTVRAGGSSIRDFLLYAVRYFVTRRQEYEWRTRDV